jgi:hypothetical protein
MRSRIVSLGDEHEGGVAGLPADREDGEAAPKERMRPGQSGGRPSATTAIPVTTRARGIRITTCHADPDFGPEREPWRPAPSLSQSLDQASRASILRPETKPYGR